MSEFNNRMEAQRYILHIINSELIWNEELFGLSKKAIERWMIRNQLDSSSNLVQAIIRTSDMLFLLANKSQEHVTDEYERIFGSFVTVTESIKNEIAALKFLKNV